VKITGSKGSRSRFDITEKGRNVLEYLHDALNLIDIHNVTAFD